MLKREMMKTVGTVAALDWNAILGDTIKEKYEALYIKLRELDSVLRRKAKAKKLHLDDHLTILTSPEVASIYDAGSSAPPGLPSDAVGILYHGTMANRWKLYSDPKIDSNKLLLGSDDHPEYCAAMTIFNFPLERKKKKKQIGFPTDDCNRLGQLASGDLDAFYGHMFAHNEDVGKGTYDTDSFESTYNLEHTPICLGTTTGSIFFGNKVSSTFVIDETGSFNFTPTKKSNITPAYGHLDLETGKMVLTWPVAIPSTPSSLRPRCVVSYEYDRETAEARELGQLASYDGGDSLDIFYNSQFIQNEDAFQSAYDDRGFKTTYILERTPICRGTMTGSILFQDTVSATFVVDETGAFTFNAVKENYIKPIHGHLDLVTGEMFLTWPNGGTSIPKELSPRCIVSYECNMPPKEDREPQKEFIITIDGKKNLDTVGGLIEQLQQYDPDMPVAIQTAWPYNTVNRTKSLKVHPSYTGKKQIGKALVIMPDANRLLWVKK